MEVIREILGAIESDWRLLVLFGLFMLHLQTFAAIGIFNPRQINQPNPGYKYNIHLFGKFVIGFFEWVGFKAFTRPLSSGKQANYYLLGFYYFIVIK
jgi:hypothetical protein